MRLLKKILQVLSLWLPPIVWLYVIYSFSANRAVKTFELYWQDFIVKKLAHFGEYAILSVLLTRGLMGSNITLKKAAIYSIFLSMVFGASDELHQSFIPGREPRIRDVLIDSVGGSFGGYFSAIILPKLYEKIR